MNFICIFGPQAVGKMTVGQALAEKTGYKLLHNHMTLELLGPLFDFSKETFQLSDAFRLQIFEKFAKTNQKGLIFTFVWNFDSEYDWDYVKKIAEIFERNGVKSHFVELQAPLSTRLERNRTENRLLHKPSKRDLTWSDEDLKQSMEKYRLQSNDGEITFQPYMKMHNENLSAESVATKIIEHFSL